ncbi:MULTISPECIES: HIRAN domain-containing protein [unclassified Sphingomonas]|uniref:HIRAN domain-containing protein n=1 Tax=unclassified Sphingomonas TaxID=196159 RepID=UPI00226A8347|nr:MULTISPECIES: HIRAN domain-containing protein [unclassified Sphingomonas]
MQELTLTVVGIDFANDDKSKSNRRMELLLCPPGEPVRLQLEPKNPHDPNAISVWSARNVQLGYLSAERAGWIGGRIRSGEEHEVIFQGLYGDAGYVRIRFGGGAPTLPPAPLSALPPARPCPARRTPVMDEDAFYPDEDGPAWGA